MLKLWYAPRTRAVRVIWLLEELGLPYTLERVEFAPTSNEFFIQKTPLGKLPVLEDGEVLMCESGAIVEYLLERSLGALGARSPAGLAYEERLQGRPALQRTLALG